MGNIIRGDGTTTFQMRNSPYNSTYIWCNPYLWYPEVLSYKLGREDLLIESPFILEWSGNWRGLRNFVVVDHALVLNRKYERALVYLETEGLLVKYRESVETIIRKEMYC